VNIHYPTALSHLDLTVFNYDLFYNVSDNFPCNIKASLTLFQIRDITTEELL